MQREGANVFLSVSQQMKIALKYGLLITAVVIVWIVVVRLLMGVGPESNASLIAPILFNLTAILAIYFGIIEHKTELQGELTFKQGLKTGVAISFVYAVSACLFFLIQYLIAGPKLLVSETGPQSGPMWQVAAAAYAGLFLGSLIFGMIYSTIISFLVAKRLEKN